ncbi:MAG: calcium/sodium antiporter [Pseudomonadota bacterium]
MLSSLWIPIFALVIGLVFLVWSADRFLSGAAATATNAGVSKMMIGLTVVSLGTSAPEILVALAAALDGNPLLAIGNAVGSNIANIGLVLGITAIIAPLPFSGETLRTELPWLFGATALALLLLFDQNLSRLDGLLLLAGLALILFGLLQRQSTHPDDISEAISQELEELPEMPMRPALFWLVFGLVILLCSANLLVWAATEIAIALGVSELIIGLTIVAIGTSLPELAATVGSALKGHTDIAVGNVVGSNILNILAVMSVPALVHPIGIDAAVFWRDCGMMVALTLLLGLFAYGMNSRAIITRFEGIVLILSWVGYNCMLYIQA